MKGPFKQVLSYKGVETMINLVFKHGLSKPTYWKISSTKLGALGVM